VACRIEVQSGEPAGAVFELHEGENVLGRSKKSDIYLTETDVSRTHLTIRVSGERATAENVSQYGTRVDQERIASPTLLKDGCRIYIGLRTCLVFHASAASAEQAPAAEPSPTHKPPPGPSSAPAAAAEVAPKVPPPRTPAAAPLARAESSRPPAPAGISIDRDAGIARIALEPEGPAEADDDEIRSGFIDFVVDNRQTDESFAEPVSLPGGSGEALGAGVHSGAASLAPAARPLSETGEPSLAVPDDDGVQHTRGLSDEAVEYLRQRQDSRIRIRQFALMAGIVLLLLITIILIVTT
jgi:hypothetical protein